MSKIRLASEKDIDWVNQKYDEVGFPHSNIENEIIAIAEIEGEKAGLGRIIKIDKNNAEMGGIYVLEKFRGQKAATEIINFLLKNSKEFQNIFCLPFENLQDYYQKFGYQELSTENYKIVPEKILKKHQWCNENFEKKVLLFHLKNKKT